MNYNDCFYNDNLNSNFEFKFYLDKYKDEFKSRLIHSNPMKSLDNLRNVLSLGRDGLLEEKFYLAAIAPGLGKSKLIVESLSAWIKDGSLKDGALIAVSTKEEIERFRNEMDLEAHHYAVCTSDHSINAWGLGLSKSDDALVLFTTHQMLRSRLSKSNFNDADCFHYKGKPRALRVWDEGMLPAEPITLRIDELRALSVPLRASHGSFIDGLETFLLHMDSLSKGDTVEIPLLLLAQARSLLMLPKLTGHQRKLLEGLDKAGDRPLELAKVNSGLVLVGCSTRFPADLAPIIILDGSGDVRTTYTHWEAHCSDLERLAPAVIDYSNLTIYYWNKGFGDDVMASPAARESVLKEVADVINAKGSEEWLLIHKLLHNPPAVLKPRIAAPANLKARHWGVHHGTNAYRDIKNVVVLGVLDYPETAYTAYHLAATNCPPGGTSDDEGNSIRQGELAHNLRQAICRGNVRNQTGGVCGETEVYLVSGTHHMKAILRKAFPGCVIKDWEPIPRKLKNWERIREAVLDRFKNPATLAVTKKEIRHALGLRANVMTATLKRPSMTASLKSAGIIVNRNSFVRLPPS